MSERVCMMVFLFFLFISLILFFDSVEKRYNSNSKSGNLIFVSFLFFFSFLHVGVIRWNYVWWWWWCCCSRYIVYLCYEFLFFTCFTFHNLKMILRHLFNILLLYQEMRSVVIGPDNCYWLHSIARRQFSRHDDAKERNILEGFSCFFLFFLLSLLICFFKYCCYIKEKKTRVSIAV